MSDEDNLQADTAPQAPLSSASREPTLERAIDAPPAAAPATPMMEVTHTRIGGGAGVRVQHGGEVQRVKGAHASALDNASTRVPREMVERIMAAVESETTLEALRDAVTDALTRP
jgi:hypothetical protein